MPNYLKIHVSTVDLANHSKKPVNEITKIDIPNLADTYLKEVVKDYELDDDIDFYDFSESDKGGWSLTIHCPDPDDQQLLSLRMNS